MKPSELDAAQVICDKATTGPWEEHTGDCVFVRSKENAYVICRDLHKDDANFIALARTLLPQLLAENRKMREALEMIAKESNHSSICFDEDKSDYCAVCIAAAALQEIEK